MLGLTILSVRSLLLVRCGHTHVRVAGLGLSTAQAISERVARSEKVSRGCRQPPDTTHAGAVVPQGGGAGARLEGGRGGGGGEGTAAGRAGGTAEAPRPHRRQEAAGGMRAPSAPHRVSTLQGCGPQSCACSRCCMTQPPMHPRGGDSLACVTAWYLVQLQQVCGSRDERRRAKRRPRRCRRRRTSVRGSATNASVSRRRRRSGRPRTSRVR